MYRTTCCICDGTLEKIKTLEKYPVSYAPTVSSDDYSLEDCDIGICNECDTIQLMNLVDPLVLYREFHNNTSFSPIWQKHHDMFYNFIKDKLHGKCIEVGGTTGELIKRLKDTENYYTLDFANPENDSKNLRGDCENFDFNGFDCLVMSHVFEHLYNPRIFAKNVNGISDIFISIPNMKNYCDFVAMHREHTYLCTESCIMRLFPKYSCHVEYFEDHSIFIHLFKTKKCSENILKYFTDMENKKIDSNYIFPAGIQGVHAAYFSNWNGKAFVDNDYNKQGKFTFGKPILSPNGIDESDIYKGHSLYNKEMKLN